MLGNLMTSLLEFINSFVGNYGVAIIILTVLVRVILYPLTVKQTKSMKAMQELQPEMKKLQEKYKDDKDKLNQEMMKLYQERGANPLGGCFPLILSMIIIIPLFRAIQDMDMTGTTFLWVTNLNEPDMILVLLNGLAMVGQTYITQKTSGAAQQNKMMMWGMPIFIVAISAGFPAGVLIYWVTQTILHALQQWYINANDTGGPEKKEEKGVAKDNG
ncbi:YidC/Oxa1 family membrane protein insertase [Natronospora cellulosivora (SeqCode)]